MHFLRLLAVRWPGAQSARWLNVSGATYRFRVVAVVASGSSRPSPSSEKVYMSSAVVERKTAVLLPAPVISDARALSGTEIFIGWQVWCWALAIHSVRLLQPSISHNYGNDVLLSLVHCGLLSKVLSITGMRRITVKTFVVISSELMGLYGHLDATFTPHETKLTWTELQPSQQQLLRRL